MKKLTLIIISLSVILQSCAPVKNSNARKGELLSMNVEEKQELFALSELEYQNQMASRGLITSSVIAQGISLAADGIKKLIEIDKQKYTADYQTSLTDLYFYRNLSLTGAMDPSGIQFDGFEILRMVTTKEGVEDTAVHLSLTVDKEHPYDLINNGIIRLKINDFKLKYSKAKVPDSRWYLPWTLVYKKDKYLNMDFEIIFRAKWITTNGILYDNIEIGKFYLNLRQIPLDKEDQKEYADNLIGSTIDGYSFLVPRSYGYYYDRSDQLLQSFGQGMFNIQVNISEASKEKFVTKVVQDNYGQVIDQLANSLK